ncbi:MAG TPA: hypothetical protein VF690_06790 [Hymenobacter sp.]|jgi:hypothetical protein
MSRFLISLRLAFFGAVALAVAPVAHAQININVNPPSWGPAVPTGAQYYYIPETNGFYDVPARQYVVSRNGQWVRTATLNGFNPGNFHPVVVDYVGAQPWTRYNEYRAKYPKGVPPGQAKKMGYRANPSNGGLPPGQAKKMNGSNGDYRRDDDRGKGHGKGHGHGKH